MPKFDLYNHGRGHGATVHINKDMVEYVRDHPRKNDKCSINLKSGKTVVVRGDHRDVKRKLDL